MWNAKALATLVIVCLPACAFAQTRPRFEPIPKDVQVKRDIKYARAGEVELKLDLYLPKADKAPPLVIFVHGGAWQTGDKHSVPILGLLSHGYAIASISYRLTDVAPFPAQIFDCKAAVRFLRAHADDYGFDGKHIAAWGNSAGGHLVALLGTSGDVKELEGDEGNEGVSSRVQAVVDCFGPADFTILWPNGPGTGAIGKLLGGSPHDKPDVARSASPVAYATSDDPPFLISHGDKDQTVPVEQGIAMNEPLKKAGVPTQLNIVKGRGPRIAVDAADGYGSRVPG